MIRLKYVATFFTLLSLMSIVQYSQAQSFDGIINAFKSSNASAVAAHFESSVELTISQNGNSYSKNQAEIILRNFFSNHPAKSFNVVHQGNSPEGSRYFIANLVTSSTTYRTYVYAKPVAGKFWILEIRIEE